MTGSAVDSRWTLRAFRLFWRDGVDTLGRWLGGGVWSPPAFRGEPADDGKRWLQPLNVAGPSVVLGRRSRVSGEGGTEEGVWSGLTLRPRVADDGKRV